MVYVLRQALFPVALSFMLAYFLDPLVDRFEARKIGRSTAIVILLAVFLLFSALFLLIFVPLIGSELERFLERLPGLLSTLRERLVPWLERVSGQEISALMAQATEKMAEWGRNFSGDGAALAARLIGRAFSGTFAVVSVFVTAALVPIFTFYFLRDFDEIKIIPLDYIPPRHRDRTVELFREIDGVLAGFLHGQLIVCLAMGLLYAIGFAVSGVPLGFLVGLVAGAVAFIPYLGSVVGVGLSLILCLLDWQGAGPLIGLGITFAIVQTLESFVLTPKIVGDKVGLSPVAVILALLLAGELMGFTGILIAVPLAAVVKILLGRLKELYRNTEYFREG